MQRPTASLLLGSLMVFAATFSILGTKAPEVRPDDSPADRFSALRARQHLEAIARKPHAMGTAEHQRVGAYLVDELVALGLRPELQETVSVRERRGQPLLAANVTNVMARLEGREDGPAILVATHYDTVPHSPGAADPGAAVAALLEAIRALRQGPPLARDVIFLFTDCEEWGLLGAKAFVERHPWAADVGMVLNFDARGTRGPSVMFETSPGNGWLIRELGRAKSRPVAPSYAYEVYKRLPNLTDFSIFRSAGLAGMNIAFIHGATAYHTAQDSLERLDLRSVQDLGEVALELTRQLGNADPERDRPGSDAVYFNLGSALVSYPVPWVLPLAVLLGLGTTGLLVLGFRRHRLSVGGLLLCVLANLLGAALVGGLLMAAVGTVFPQKYNFALWHGWSSESLNLLALALVALGLTISVDRLARVKLSSDDLVAGGLLVWSAVTVAASVTLPGTSYLFALPLFLSLVAALGSGRPPQEAVSVPFVAWLALAAGATALLWAPTLALIGVAMGRQAAPLVGVGVFLLLFGLLAPQMAWIQPRKRAWILPVTAVACGLVLLAAVRSASAYSSANRRPNSVLYVLDAEAGEAYWLSPGWMPPDAWTAQFLGEVRERGPRLSYLPLRGLPFRAPAPVAPLGRARVELVAAEPGPQVRTLRLAIRWPFEVHRANLFLRSQGEIRALSLGGQRIERSENFGPGDAAYRMTVNYLAPPPAGILLTVEMAGDDPLEIETVSERYELPQGAGFSYEPRAADMMPASDWSTDSTLVRSLHVLHPAAASATREGIAAD